MGLTLGTCQCSCSSSFLLPRLSQFLQLSTVPVLCRFFQLLIFSCLFSQFLSFSQALYFPPFCSGITYPVFSTSLQVLYLSHLLPSLSLYSFSFSSFAFSVPLSVQFLRWVSGLVDNSAVEHVSLAFLATCFLIGDVLQLENMHKVVKEYQVCSRTVLSWQCLTTVVVR